MLQMTTHEFEHTARQLRPLLLAVGRRFFGDDDRAEDVAQETLMRLWQLRHRIGEDDNVQALAVSMAKNWCVSVWRREQHWPEADVDLAGSRASETPLPLETQELVEQLWQAVNSLPPPEQRLFRMRHELEMDIGQIAAATGIKPRSVSAMLSKARKKVRKIMQEGGLL